MIHMTNHSSNNNSETPKNQFQKSTIKSFIKNKQVGTIEGLVTHLEDCQEIPLKSGKTSMIQKLIIQDETGKIRVTLWGKNCRPELENYDNIQLEGAFLKFNSYSKQNEAQLTDHGKIVRTAWPNASGLYRFWR